MLTDLAGKLPLRGTVLDLCCEPRGFSRYFARRGFRVTTVPEPVAELQSSLDLDTDRCVAAIERFIRNGGRGTAPPAQRYDLVILRNVLPFIDPTILEDLAPWIAAHGYLYIRTFAEDDAISQQHQFVPREYIETALEGFVKMEDRSFWEQGAPDSTTVQPHHVIEMLFCKA